MVHLESLNELVTDVLGIPFANPYVRMVFWIKVCFNEVHLKESAF